MMITKMEQFISTTRHLRKCGISTVFGIDYKTEQEKLVWCYRSALAVYNSLDLKDEIQTPHKEVELFITENRQLPNDAFSLNEWLMQTGNNLLREQDKPLIDSLLADTKLLLGNV